MSERLLGRICLMPFFIKEVFWRDLNLMYSETEEESNVGIIELVEGFEKIKGRVKKGIVKRV